MSKLTENIFMSQHPQTPCNTTFPCTGPSHVHALFYFKNEYLAALLEKAVIGTDELVPEACILKLPTL